ncbi:Pantothenate kinase 2 [Camellia lanceoleosa]|uniref:Pantothenate kinase 2 n=1 Tax=Camellia lanceoleosa TaxID=1840588 RepID=A0ACC0IVW1_9ERIC|nr:Pantothenate kinase 2 [Camellia lanceoleosa]
MHLCVTTGTETRLLTLIEGVLAANIFDWGSHACVDLYHKGTIIEIYRMSRKKMQRPWQVDDFDLFKERMFGSGDKKPPPHKRALLFVHNSGADVILEMLPLARELLRRGTEVVLVANSLSALNDVTAMELPDIVAEAAKVQCGDVEFEKKIDEKIGQFIDRVEKHPSKKIDEKIGQF